MLKSLIYWEKQPRSSIETNRVCKEKNSIWSLILHGNEFKTNANIQINNQNVFGPWRAATRSTTTKQQNNKIKWRYCINSVTFSIESSTAQFYAIESLKRNEYHKLMCCVINMKAFNRLLLLLRNNLERHVPGTVTGSQHYF